ncbi:MAG: polysaccharide biosynthesis protein [Phycisphaerales bacterium]|nr:polysaccharide biosynthesis protein [Phycisphaerales bacterium]
MNESFFQPLWQWRIRHRVFVYFWAHAVLFGFALLISFLLRYNLRIDGEWFLREYLTYLPLTLVIKLSVFGAMKLYRDSWRYVGLRDLFGICKATHLSTIFCIAAVYASRPIWIAFCEETGYWIPESIFLLDWVFTIATVSGARIAFRFYNEELRPLEGAKRARLLIVGAGDAGDSILREIVRTSENRYRVVGFLDDDPGRQSVRIRGIEVMGKTERIREICDEQDIDEVLIALPSAPQRWVRRLIEQCQGLNLQFRTVPAVSDLIEGKVQVSQIRPVDIEDLLGRESVTLDTEAIGQYIRGKVVMITGAGGSIGSEMCRQIAQFNPKKLLLIERMENALFEINRELERECPALVRVPYVADIADASRLDRILAEERPSAIFHAAAHKHVPMMEWNPGEALKNNIVGTRTLADLAAQRNVEKFVMISTDKAVNPTSVMGCSKRVAEMYVQQLGGRVKTRTEFVTVRFGNVLGSNGSVVPIFKEQIAQGGPVTVTHPEMTRYFMTIPEASQLVLQAGAMGRGGEIFLLDMGEPVKIVDLARDLITLSGLRPGEDIEIRFSGIRPGEKLFEELSITGEDVSRTSHSKLGIIKKRPEDFERICAGIENLITIADTSGPADIRAALKQIVPEYEPVVPATEQPASVNLPDAQAAPVA